MSTMIRFVSDPSVATGAGMRLPADPCISDMRRRGDAARPDP